MRILARWLLLGYGALLSVFHPRSLAAAEHDRRFHLPPGFTVEQAAAPPLVRYPLFACFDDRGRLYVAEGTGTNLPGEELAKKKLGRIVRLVDTDGDGRFDDRRVFADGLVFPQGVLWHEGALYTASHPSFWKLEDPGDTGTATRRTELATGFNFNGNGCDIHGPFLGPDGRLYWSDGRHGYKLKTREGEYLEGLAARIWRCRTDGSELERLCGGGFDNPVEIVFTPEGEAIGTMDQGTGDCLLHYVEGAVYPMEHPCLKEFAMTGPLLGAVRQYMPVLPAALCGLTRYRSAAFGPQYQGSLFATHYMLHRVVQNTLVRDGSTYRAEEQEFLTATDHNMRLTDVLEDPDGSLLVVDMGAWFTYGFPGNPLPRPDSLGGIYRVRHVGATVPDDPWGHALELAGRSPSELTEWLDDERPHVRDRVVELLARNGDAAVGELERVIASNRGSVPARQNAVWALCRIGTPAAQRAVRPALGDAGLDVRLAATHVVGLLRDAEASDELTRLVTSDEPPVRLKAAEALGRIGRDAAVPALVDGLRCDTDRFLEHALIYALIRIDSRSATLPMLIDADARVRKAGLVALDQMPEGRLTRADVGPLAADPDVGLQSALLDIAARRPGWSDVTCGIARRWLAGGDLSAAQETSLAAALLSSSGDRDVQQVVFDAWADARTPNATRRLLLDVWNRAIPLPESWLAALGTALDNDDEAIRRQALGVVKTRKLGRFDDRLAALSREPSLPIDVRLSALECLVERCKELDAPAFELLVAQLGETAEPLARLAAARTLAASALSAEQQFDLARAMAAVNTLVLRTLLPLFAKAADERLGAALVDALEQSTAAEALRAEELDKVLAAFPADIRRRADGLRRKLVARQQGQAEYLGRLAAELTSLSGDAAAGQQIFLAQKVGCYGCHRAVGRGGQVGPDLSRIGQFRSRAELLESILFPNSIVAPEYRALQVVGKDGRTFVGLLTRDAPEAVYLRTAELAEIRIDRDEIDELAPSNLSVMPEGLEKTLTRQQLCDLVEFLCQQR